MSKEAIGAHISRLPHGDRHPNTSMERFKVAQAAAQVSPQDYSMVAQTAVRMDGRGLLHWPD